LPISGDTITPGGCKSHISARKSPHSNRCRCRRTKPRRTSTGSGEVSRSAGRLVIHPKNRYIASRISRARHLANPAVGSQKSDGNHRASGVTAFANRLLKNSFGVNYTICKSLIINGRCSAIFAKRGFFNSPLNIPPTLPIAPPGSNRAQNGWPPDQTPVMEASIPECPLGRIGCLPPPTPPHPPLPLMRVPCRQTVAANSVVYA